MPPSSNLRGFCLALRWCVALLALTLGGPALAQGKGLILDAVPLLGGDVPSGNGWFSCAVRLENTTEAQLDGTLELTSEIPWTSGTAIVITRAPFALAGKGRVTMELPTHGFESTAPTLFVVARSASGDELARFEIGEPRVTEPLLFDFNSPSRLAPGLRGKKVAVSGSRLRGTYGAPMLALGSPGQSPATGDPVLPARASGYAAVTLVFAKSEQVARLKGAELEALGNWVLAGGALALTLSRPEDLKSPVLQALVGAGFQQGPPEPSLKGKAQFILPDETSRSRSYGGGYGATLAVEHAPTEAVAGNLVGFSGGQLRSSPWGASASYGLGEVHLLAFDASREPEVNDEWVQHKLLDLVRHAWERQATQALRHGAGALDQPQAQVVRRLLDPNEGARWAIAVALLLLLIYAVLAGPLNFHLASRRGRPLRALIHLPIWALGALLIILGLGAVSKGIEGRSRRVSLIEAGAGMTRAPITRYRGFYASSASELLVRGSEPGSVLDVFGESEGKNRILFVDRDGLRLEQVRARPWEIVLVREDAFVPLGGGVSVVQRGTDVVVKNLLARDLRGVLLKVPGQQVRFFDRIADGATVKHTDGTAVGVPSSSGRAPSFVARNHAPELDGAQKGLSDAWAALQGVAGHGIQWWPDDAPVLLAQIEGGEGVLVDSGLRVDSDRLLIRVVGFGGLP